MTFKEKLQKETWKIMLKLINDLNYLYKFLKWTPHTPQYINDLELIFFFWMNIDGKQPYDPLES